MLKLSIIIPVYNVEKYLAKCLDSVIYTDVPDYEIIVVNDGSPDSSPQIAQEYVKKYPKLIRLINQENGGLGAARNTGIDAAEGEFLMFLDSDDWLCENAVPEMLEAVKQDFDIGIFDNIVITEQGRVLKHEKGIERDGTFCLEEYPELIFDPPCAWNKLYRRSLFIDTGIRFPGRLWFEDICTSPKLYLHCTKITHISKCWYNYLLRQGSITQSKNIGRNPDIITAMDITLDYYKSIGKYDQYKSQLEYMVYYNEFITSSVRVNLIDRKNELQDRLIEYFLNNFPNYKENPYVKSAPAKYKLIDYLIIHRRRFLLNTLMKFNNRVKGK